MPWLTALLAQKSSNRTLQYYSNMPAISFAAESKAGFESN